MAARPVPRRPPIPREDLVVTCPHCQLLVAIPAGQINCGIFRHGFNLATQHQVPPHASREACERYLQDPNVAGCCKPFRVSRVDGVLEAEICDYI